MPRAVPTRCSSGAYRAPRRSRNVGPHGVPMPGDVVVPDRGVDGEVRPVDHAGGDVDAVGGVLVVHVARPRHRDRSSGCDVGERTRPVEPVQGGVGEAVGRTRPLVGERHDPGEERARQARAADPVDVEVHAVAERLRLSDEHPGVRVTVDGDVGHDPAALGAHLRECVGHDRSLVVGFGVVAADAAPGPVEELTRVPGPPPVPGERGEPGLPAPLDHGVSACVHAEARATDRGHERRGAREVRRGAAEHRRLVAVVPTREVEADALERGRDRDPVERGVLRRRHVLTAVAVGVGDDVGAVVGDDVVERDVQVVVEATRSADVEETGAGGHGVHRLEVEGLLAVPARRVALVGRLEARIGLGEDALRVLARCERVSWRRRPARRCGGRRAPSATRRRRSPRPARRVRRCRWPPRGRCRTRRGAATGGARTARTASGSGRPCTAGPWCRALRPRGRAGRRVAESR